eukprot:CAMPEP_0174863744 /NCGR_PEP_ID=MMETSP1114-20130205/56853_1 /TAXON_ID=312471 /ORGANISM="Neobodo designis, Strain CCAP 1951/1" /LENGTH=503 /DNA_ID=CAMNT_0016098821 /DNA_START=47 /DNA_END=1554 /DNA_ORIENTATION=+
MKVPDDLVGVAAVVGVGGYLVASTLGFFAYKRRQRAEAGRLSSPVHSSASRFDERSPTVSDIGHLLKWPLAGAGAVVAVCANAARLTAAVPSVLSSYGSSASAAISPLFADTKSQAFALGRAYEALVAAIGGDINASDAAVTDSDAARHALKLAADATGRNVTVAQLLRAPADLLLQDNQRSVGDRFLGALSLVNIVWLGSILLIACLAVPALYAVATPLRRVLREAWERVVYPALVAMKPAYEPLAYAAVAFVALESHRFPAGRHDMAGTMVATTAVGLFSAAWAYSTTKHATDTGGKRSSTFRSLWQGTTATLIAVVSGALAVSHQSTLLGYIAVTSVLVAAGFTAVGYPLCLFIGFRGRSQALHVASICLLLTMTNAAFRATDVSATFTRPFESAVAVVGTSVYFLALSIVSVMDGGFGVAVYAANLAGYVVLGSLLAIPGMVNAALAWAAVEVFVLSGYHLPKRDMNVVVVYAFVASCALYAASLYVSTHPEVLSAMLR